VLIVASISFLCNSALACSACFRTSVSGTYDFLTICRSFGLVPLTKRSFRWSLHCSRVCVPLGLCPMKLHLIEKAAASSPHSKLTPFQIRPKSAIDSGKAPQNGSGSAAKCTPRRIRNRCALRNIGGYGANPPRIRQYYADIHKILTLP